MGRVLTTNIALTLFYFFAVFAAACIPAAVRAATPEWTSNVPTTVIELGQTGQVTVSATGGSETQIDCLNCTLATIQDHGDGTATVTWDTGENPPANVEGLKGVSLRAVNKADSSEFVIRQILFQIIDPSTSGGISFTSIPAPLEIAAGEVGQSVITAIGASDIQLLCTNCTSVQFQANGGVGVATWDTAKNPPSQLNNAVYINIRAYSASSPNNFIEGQMVFVVVGEEKPSTPAPAAPTARPSADTSNSEFVLPSGVSDLNQLGTTSIPVLVGRFVSILVGIAGSVALAVFVYGGFLWMTSLGSVERAGKAKSLLVWSALGVLVILASYAIVNFLFDIF